MNQVFLLDYSFHNEWKLYIALYSSELFNFKIITTLYEGQLSIGRSYEKVHKNLETTNLQMSKTFSLCCSCRLILAVLYCKIIIF